MPAIADLEIAVLGIEDERQLLGDEPSRHSSVAQQGREIRDGQRRPPLLRDCCADSLRRSLRFLPKHDTDSQTAILIPADSVLPEVN